MNAGKYVVHFDADYLSQVSASDADFGRIRPYPPILPINRPKLIHL
jgi:hypothetical protein